MIEYIVLGYILVAIAICLKLFAVLKDEIFKEFSFAVPYIILASAFWPASLAINLIFYFRSKRDF